MLLLLLVTLRTGIPSGPVQSTPPPKPANAQPQASPAPKSTPPAPQDAATKPAPPQAAPHKGQPAPPAADKTAPPDKSAAAKPAAADPLAVTTQPNPLYPGQEVSFYWPAGTVKVAAQGGGFVKQETLPSLWYVTDKPGKTTTYHFDLWIKQSKSSDSSAAPASPGTPTGAAKAPATPASEVVKISREVTVQVEGGTAPAMATYHDKRGWRIDCIQGWNRYVTDLPDPANNELIFFEPHEDSPVRTAVGVLPANNMTLDDLASKIKEDAGSQFDVVKDLKYWPTTECSHPAIIGTIAGMDSAIPNDPLDEIFIGVIRDGKAYVISGRTPRSKAATYSAILRSLVRSFAFEPPDAHRAADAPGSIVKEVHRQPTGSSRQATRVGAGHVK